MGRKKLEIKRLRTAAERQTTYTKRKTGIAKKASELAILCDVQLALLAFSPKDKPLLTLTPDSDLSSVVKRLSEVDVYERITRRAETIEVLEKQYKDSDDKVQINRLLGDVEPTLQDLTKELENFKLQLEEKSEKLRAWMNVEGVDDLNKLENMEKALVAQLDGIQKHKVLIRDIEEQAKGTTSRKKRYNWLPQQEDREAVNLGATK